ncbi:hypothetical protein LSH36_34g00027 [Paralvinella palmiformis]|uniref:Endonuclease/exonuclease/phosphatase domain-containing protein n=1 Tax=Paralvinella palmiformis TaxID=53620 RepID=A0AAD9KAF3_9ANNE|nr:hypothetical protein LSH36_34g00027 [Paralvinella palmiformis]
MKSNTDPEQVIDRRAYGGIDLICPRRSDLVSSPINVECDRISGIKRQSNGEHIPVLTVFGVYLPNCNGKADQIQCYSEVLDILQECIDSYHQSAVLVVGDMNESLPHTLITCERLAQKTTVYCSRPSSL